MQNGKLNTGPTQKIAAPMSERIDRKRITLLFVAIQDTTPVNIITVVKLSWVAFKIQQQLLKYNSKFITDNPIGTYDVGLRSHSCVALKVIKPMSGFLWGGGLLLP